MSAPAGRTILVAGGGTGGHVTMALALAESFQAAGDEVLLLGSERDVEQRMLADVEFERLTLPARQVMGQRRLAAARAVIGLAGPAWRARRLLRERRVDLVVSVGGYAAMPAVLAARTRRTPLVLVEPNAIPGRTNRLAAARARRVFVGFEAAAARFPARVRKRVRVTGIPLRPGRTHALIAHERRHPTPPLRILVTGGSQGAHQLNELMQGALSSIDPARIEVVHQTGSDDLEAVRGAYAAAGIHAEVVGFDPALAEKLAWADLVVARAGALTVAELMVAGMPSILVPYPYAADDHQTANARSLREAGAAVVLDPHDLGVPEFTKTLDALVSDPERLVAMGLAARRLASPDASERIVAECHALLDSDTRGARRW